MNKAIVGMLAGLMLSACATTQQYSPMATRADLKPGNALIRVERESGIVGAELGCEHFCHQAKVSLNEALELR